MLIDEFDRAAHVARAMGVCPISLLPEFYSNHWLFQELCQGFNCEHCYATPQDMGAPEGFTFEDRGTREEITRKS